MARSAQTTEEYMRIVCAAGRKAALGEDAAEELRAVAQAESGAECFLPAAHLRDACGLTDAETLLLYVCIARIGSGEPLPGTAEALRLLASFGAPPWEGGSPLFTPGADGGCLHPAAVDFLLQRAPRLGAHARLEVCEARPVYHSAAQLETLGRFFDGLTALEPGRTAAAAVCGEEGTGRRFLLSQLAAKKGFALLWLGSPDAIDADTLDLVCRIYNAVPCAVNAVSAWPLLRGAALALYTAPRAGVAGLSADAVLRVDTQPMSAADSVRAVTDVCGTEAAAVWAQAAAVYRPSVSRLLAACARANAAALCGDTVPEAFLAALRQESCAALTEGAQRVAARFGFDDIVLAPDAERRLREVCAFARARPTVWDGWGFAKRSGAGRGITALFYGASGTGKTMAASVVATELGLELYRVDLSQLISKYVGETQKNIGRVFDAAERADCVLLFDEADALFARRSDAADAQDRYSNAEIAYLLQRTEQYDGIILLATNLLQNFDEAFRRRIGFMIHFTAPDEARRLRLWRLAVPDAAPAAKLDFGLLAAQLELSGAGIRSAALGAAYLAASEGGKIDMERVVRAARREYEKEGRAFPPRLDAMYPPERSNT